MLRPEKPARRERTCEAGTHRLTLCDEKGRLGVNGRARQETQTYILRRERPARRQRTCEAGNTDLHPATRKAGSASTGVRGRKHRLTNCGEKGRLGVNGRARQETQTYSLRREGPARRQRTCEVGNTDLHPATRKAGSASTDVRGRKHRLTSCDEKGRLGVNGRARQETQTYQLRRERPARRQRTCEAGNTDLLS